MQRSEQVFTLSQSRAHFRRQENGRPQAAQSLSGVVAFGRLAAFITNPCTIIDLVGTGPGRDRMSVRRAFSAVEPFVRSGFPHQ